MRPLAIIPTYLAEESDVEVTMTCLRSLAATPGDLIDILVVDDCSPQQALVERLITEITNSQLKLDVHRKEKNTGFAQTVNIGLRRSLQEGRDAILVNADLEFRDAGWLEAMMEQTDSQHRPAAVVGALLLYPNDLIQHGGIFFSYLHRCFEHIFKYAPRNLPEAQNPRVCPVTGALQYIRHETLASVGVYDEDFKMGWEDVDYCLRVFESGRECVYTPRALAYHHESLFRGRGSKKLAEWQAESWLYWCEKWGSKSMAQFVPTEL